MPKNFRCEQNFSIVVVNHQSYRFLNLLLQSLDRFSNWNHIVIVFDNESHLSIEFENVVQVRSKVNLGHGGGINECLQLVETENTLIFDSDIHVIREGWDERVRAILEEHELLALQPNSSKPIRGGFGGGRTALLKGCDFRASVGYRGVRKTPQLYDTGMRAAQKLLAAGHKTAFLACRPDQNIGTKTGEEILVDDTAIAYHHWHGSHLTYRQKDFPQNNLILEAEKVFRHYSWFVDNPSMIDPYYMEEKSSLKYLPR